MWTRGYRNPEEARTSSDVLLTQGVLPAPNHLLRGKLGVRPPGSTLSSACLLPDKLLTPKVHCWDPPDPWHFMSRGGSDERVSDMSRQRRLFKTNSCSSL